MFAICQGMSFAYFLKYTVATVYLGKRDFEYFTKISVEYLTREVKWFVINGYKNLKFSQ